MRSEGSYWSHSDVHPVASATHNVGSIVIPMEPQRLRASLVSRVQPHSASNPEDRRASQEARLPGGGGQCPPRHLSSQLMARITHDHIDHLERHGYAAVPEFLTPEELSAARSNMSRYFPTPT